MRPQIRSLPLYKVECPQFSWAVRNNSENVSVVLQPDLQRNEEARKVLVGDNEINRIAQNKSCYCFDDKLRPTLFPHPVSCVCSNVPYPPNCEKYRYCKLDMDHAIGDVMEEIIIETVASPAPKTEKLMKKIIRSAYIPDDVDLTDKNACVECLAKDPTLLKNLLDSMKYKKGLQDNIEDRMYNHEAGDCKRKSQAKEECDCLKNNLLREPEPKDGEICRWKKDTICTCKKIRHDNYVECDKCRCKCPKRCLKCNTKEDSLKLIESPKKIPIEHPKRIEEERKVEDKVVHEKVAEKVVQKKVEKKIAEKKVEKKVAEKKVEEKVIKIKKSSKKIPKEKEPVVTHAEPQMSSPPVKKPKKIKVKSPVKPREKSPQKVSGWQRPNNIICERSEIEEETPFHHMQETGVSQSTVPIYEHFRAVRPLGSGSSRSDRELEETLSLTRPKSSVTQKNLVRNPGSNTKYSKRTRVENNKPTKMPWNWNNQPKVEDPYKNWGGKRYSWSQKLNYAALDKKLEENNERLIRSRGGDDVVARSRLEGPKYYEYRPNLRSKSFKQSATADNEEEINKKEQRRYRNGYGRMRVKNWQQTLEENVGKNVRRDQELPEEISESSKDDSEEDNQQTVEEDGHDKNQCLQCLMSNVQQKFTGSSKCLCQHGAKEGDNQEEPRRDERLPTILEENSGRCEWKSDGSQEMNRHCCPENKRCQFIPETLKEGPNTSDGSSEDSPRDPFFNNIKQRIHSRGKTLENLNIFTNEHFPKQTETEHTCVHRFTIDDRLFPKPLHCDDSGTSCCVHCDKPMTVSEKSVFSDQRELKVRVGDENGAQKKLVSKFGLRQKPVHIGGKNSVMEIRLRPEHDELLTGYGRERGVKREFYRDSMALRHQWR